MLMISSFCQCPTKNAGSKELYTEALTNVIIPGEAGFPLSSLYQKPSKADGGKFLYE